MKWRRWGMLEPIVADAPVDLSQIAAEWEQNLSARAEELESGSDYSYRKLLLPAIDKFLSRRNPDASVLDAGCGLGFVTEHAVRAGFHAKGIDVCQASIAYARNQFQGIEFSGGSIEEYANGSGEHFDVIVANMVLHNAPSLHDCIESLSQLAHPDGVVFVSIPHPCFWLQSRSYRGKLSFRYTQRACYKLPFKITNGRAHPSRFSYFHRPLEHYLTAFSEAGFHLLSAEALGNGRSGKVADLLVVELRRM